MIKRWIGFLLAILCGIGAGLFYGWVINPPEHAELSPESLRIDFRTDYVLMAAEAFSGEGRLEKAIERLAVFDKTSPMEITLQALIFAQEIGYTDADLAKLQNLLTEIQAYTFSQGKLTP